MLVKAGIYGDVYELIGCMYFMRTFHVYEYSLSFKIFIIEMTKSQATTILYITHHGNLNYCQGWRNGFM